MTTQTDAQSISPDSQDPGAALSPEETAPARNLPPSLVSTPEEIPAHDGPDGLAAVAAAIGINWETAGPRTKNAMQRKPEDLTFADWQKRVFEYGKKRARKRKKAAEKARKNIEQPSPAQGAFGASSAPAQSVESTDPARAPMGKETARQVAGLVLASTNLAAKTAGGIVFPAEGELAEKIAKAIQIDPSSGRQTDRAAHDALIEYLATLPLDLSPGWVLALAMSQAYMAAGFEAREIYREARGES